MSPDPPATKHCSVSDDTILREKRRRLRKLKVQQARFGIGTPPEIEIA